MQRNWFKERFTSNKTGRKMSNIDKTKFQRVMWSNVIWFMCYLFYWVKRCRLWVHKKWILGIIFLAFTVDSSVVVNDIEGYQVYSATGNSCRDILPCSTWPWNYPSIFACWWRGLVVATSKFAVLTIRLYSATRKLAWTWDERKR